ncbi:GNAT family N-acetyltransferase [Methylobacterium sp. JK268]
MTGIALRGLGDSASPALPDLPPDLTFTLLGSSAADSDFAFQAKREALGPHVAVRWGWDEAFQRRLHEERYREKPFFAIQRGDHRLGTVSLSVLTTHVRFGEFYLLPAFQARGTGTAVLRHCLALADGLGLSVRLEYLLWNPVGALYRRWGFVEQGRSAIHAFMERPPC